MVRRQRWLTGALAVLLAAGLLLAATPVRASEEGRRKTALGLGALSVLLFTQGGNKLPALAALGGAAYAYKRYDDSMRSRHRRERAYYRRHNRKYTRTNRR